MEKNCFYLDQLFSFRVYINHYSYVRLMFCKENGKDVLLGGEKFIRMKMRKKGSDAYANLGEEKKDKYLDLSYLSREVNYSDILPYVAEIGDVLNFMDGLTKIKLTPLGVGQTVCFAKKEVYMDGVWENQGYICSEEYQRHVEKINNHKKTNHEKNQL